jgi:hypothetical protein
MKEGAKAEDMIEMVPCWIYTLYSTIKQKKYMILNNYVNIQNISAFYVRVEWRGNFLPVPALNSP